MENEYRKISFAEAKEILDKDPEAVLLDVREEAEYITGHAVDAVLLPLDELDAASAAEAIPSHDTSVLVYCRSGRRSKKAAELLANAGYRVVELSSGFLGWQSNGMSDSMGSRTSGGMGGMTRR